MVETPADAFAPLGNDIRVEILQTLADEARPGYAQQGVQFSDIQDSVSIDDGGQLNYHLDKLRGHFVQRTESGYRLRYAGWEALRVIQAGTYHEQAQRKFDAPGTCYACSEPSLRAQTRGEWLEIQCGDCETLHTAHPLPPWLLRDGEPSEIIRALDGDVRHRASLLSDRLCPECLSDVTVTIRDDVPSAWDIDVIPQFRCPHCRYWFHPPFGLLALDNHAVVDFSERHGIDPTERPYWDLSPCVDPTHLTIIDREPWRIDLQVTREGETLCVTFDDVADIDGIAVDR